MYVILYLITVNSVNFISETKKLCDNLLAFITKENKTVE